MQVMYCYCHLIDNCVLFFSLDSVQCNTGIHVYCLPIFAKANEYTVNIYCNILYIRNCWCVCVFVLCCVRFSWSVELQWIR